jgi:Uma2 family endonuclease
MPSALIAPPVEFEAIPRKKWTRDECAQLSNIVDLHQYELIDGDLIKKMGKNHPHMRAVMLLVEWLRSVFPGRMVAQEVSIELRGEDNATSEPEPDAVVLTRSFLDLAPRPKPAEIRLVAEVSDTTLAFDLSPKAALYARAEIAEYWVLDITARRLIVHRHPQQGIYQNVKVYSESESVASLAAPDVPAVVSSLF